MFSGNCQLTYRINVLEMTNSKTPPTIEKKSPPVKAMNNYPSLGRYIIHPGINLGP